ncbi:MAG TPA: calcium/proton exchanger [Mycobacteriales bacterium]|nr:calcium/proton exchanger [Mycobacteriales bacterium]
MLTRRDYRLFALVAVAAAASGVTRFVHAGTVVPFLASSVALALLAMLVGHAVDALGNRLGAGATGVVQSALGNLPELFVCIFSLRAGLDEVVRAAIVGSILANALLVLGLAFVVGGVKHGVQRFDAAAARMLCLLILLAVCTLLVPALTAALHTPAAGHEKSLSIVVSVLLLAVFALSLPAATARAKSEQHEENAVGDAEHVSGWPIWLALTVLAVAGLAAAVVSEWFVHALEPAIDTFGISQAFAGLVVVAIAGNAVENVVGIQLAARNRMDYAVSLILQSPLQIALVLAPVLVLVAPLVGASFTLVLSPLLIATLVIAVLVTVVVVLDGESTWLEGSALLALYGVLAAAFWWG